MSATSYVIIIYFVLVVFNISIQQKGAQLRLKRRQMENLMDFMDEFPKRKNVTWEQFHVGMMDVIDDDPKDLLAQRVRNRKAHPGEED